MKDILPPPSRITVLSVSAIGDLLLCLPLINEVRRLYPNARLTVMCLRPSVASLARDLRVADEVVSLPPQARRSVPALRQSLRLARQTRADLTFQSFSSHGTFGNLLAGATGASVRCGFADGRLQDRLTHRVPIDPQKHLILLNLDLMRRLGHAVHPPEGRFLPPLEDQSGMFAAERPEGKYGPYVVISPGSDPKLSFKRWSTGQWAGLCVKLCRDGFTPVFVGDAAQAEESDQIVAASRVLGVNLAGRTTFADLAALVAGSQTLIATDGMLLHLSSALGKACVGIFGPTHPDIGGPFGASHGRVYLGLPCSPCYGSLTVGQGAGCATRECLNYLPVELVYSQVQRVLERQSADPIVADPQV